MKVPFNMQSAGGKTFGVTAVLALMMALGFRHYYLYHYAPVSTDISFGEVDVEIIPIGRVLSEKEGKKIAVEEGPYSLVLRFKVGVEFDTLNLDDWALTGSTSGVKLHFEDVTKEKGRPLGAFDTWDIAVVVRNGTEGLELEYEDQLLTANMSILLEDVVVGQETISILLKTDYKEELRNDYLDSIMSP